MARRSRWRGTRICCGPRPPPRPRRGCSKRAAGSTSAIWRPEVRARTLVVHARDDRVVPVEEGRLLAALIPDARLVLLESANHILLADEPAWQLLRLRAPRVPRHRARPRPARADRRPERARAGGARAGRRRPDERGDRRAAVHQRAHGGAAPLQRLREAGRLREGGARRRGGPLLAQHDASPPELRLATCRPPGRRPKLGGAPMPARSPYVSADRRRRPGGTDEPELAQRRPSRPDRATHEIRGGGGLRLHAREWGDPARARASLHPRLVAERPLLGKAGQRRSRRRGSGSSRSTCAGTVCPRSRSGPEHYADGQLWADDLAAVIEQTGLERPLVVAWSYGGYIVADFLRAYGDAAIAAINLVGAAVLLRPPGFDHLGPGLLENARTPAPPTSPPTSPRSGGSCARAPPEPLDEDAWITRAGLEHGRAPGRPRGA